MKYKNSRDTALSLVDDGVVSVAAMLAACLDYMSTDDVTDMLDHNGFTELTDDAEEASTELDKFDALVEDAVASITAPSELIGDGLK